MPLTRRQKEFVQNLIDLSDEFDGLIHYSLLADRLGVSPITAYDMLCILERKGFVISEYQLPADKKGPGRAERLFSPSAQALGHEEGLLQRTNPNAPKGDGYTQSIHSRLRSGIGFDEEALQATLAKMPFNGNQDLAFCAEVMQIGMLCMQTYSSWPEFREVATRIFSTSGGHRQALLLLNGVLVGFLTQAHAGEGDWLQMLTEQIQHANEILLRISDAECSQLVESIQHLMFQRVDKPRYS